MHGTTHTNLHSNIFMEILIPCILRLNDGVDIHSYMYVYTLDHAIYHFYALLSRRVGTPTRVGFA
jgi:hypothetical protein